MDPEGALKSDNKSSIEKGTNNTSVDSSRSGKVGPEDTTPKLEIDNSRDRHQTILGGDAVLSTSISLHRCLEQDCCQGKVHCPFCDIRQYKPAQPSRVRDHLHLTHFQHAVYYDGLMIVKCFHVCRGSDYKGGHYHCPVCSTTLLKRNAFTKHLYSHASSQGLGTKAVQAPDSKKPAVIYYADKKIDLCRETCSGTLEPHFHCPLCQRNCDHLSALTSHLWRCKKRTVSVAARAESRFGCSLDFGKLFSPQMVQTVLHIRDVKELKEHLSVVRNLSDLLLQRCQLPECCKGRYHCPLCTTSKLKPNHLSHMRQHFVSHWRSGVKFRDYTVLVCYLPCQLEMGADTIRFHYHCPLCGVTRRRREGFTRHLVICESSQAGGQGSDEVEKVEELDNDEGDNVMEFPSFSDSTLTPSSTVETWSSHQAFNTAAQATATRRVSADQAELQAAESLAALDRILTESLNNNCLDSSSQILEDSSSADHQPQTGLLLASKKAQPVMSEKDSTGLSINENCPSAVSEELNVEVAAIFTEVGAAVKQKPANADLAVASVTSQLSQQANVELSHQSGNGSEIVVSDTKREPSEILRKAQHHPGGEDRVSVNDQSTDTGAAGEAADVSVNSGLSRLKRNVTEAKQNGGDTLSSKMDGLDVIHSSTNVDISSKSVCSIPQITQTNAVTGSKARIITHQLNERTPNDQPDQNIPNKQSSKTISNEQDEGNIQTKTSKQSSPNNQSEDGSVSLSELPDTTAAASHCEGSNKSVVLTGTVKRSIEGNSETIPTKETAHDSSEKRHADDLQIFQQVSTQISDSIVSQLEDRGGLDCCLQAIGQVCKVAWQHHGTGVTMTCELEELCHAQNCLKQIVKDGLQTFLDSPPPRPSTSAISNVTARTPKKTGARKRGRPKGSKNRRTSAAAQRSADQLTSKEDAPSEEPDASDGQKSDTTSSSSHKYSSHTSSEIREDRSLSPPSKVAKLSCDPTHTNSSKMRENMSLLPSAETPAGSDVGRYSGRTRGKRINFAQLHAGNISHLHEEDSEEEQKKTVAPVSLPVPKRGRGRPRKYALPSGASPVTATSQDVEKIPAEDQTGKQADMSAVTVQEVSKTEPHTVGDRDGGHKEKICEAEEDGERHADEEAVSVALSRLSGNLLPDVFIDVKRNSNAAPGPPSMEIVVTRSSLPSGEPLSSSSGRPAAKQRSLLTTEVSNVSSSGEQALGQRSREESQWVEENTDLAKKAKTPTIHGGEARKRRLHSEKGVSDFVIIPNIFFNGEKEVKFESPEEEGMDVSVESAAGDDAGGTPVSSDLQQHAGEDADDERTGSRLSLDITDAETTGESKLDQGQGQSRRCPMCSLTLDCYPLLAQHITSQHAGKAPVSCDICEMVFPTSGALSLHLERCHGPRLPQEAKSKDCAYRCVSCDKSYLTAGALQTHCSLVHDKKSTATLTTRRSSLKCVVCNYVAIDRWDMRRHRDQHRLQPPTCPVCKKTLSTEAALKVHIAAKHSGESFSCQICSKTFAHVRYLHAHMQRHGGEKRHVCTVCGWRFHQTNTLQAHMDTHKPRTQRKYAYKCPHCPAAYNSGANWRDHLNKHTGARPHVCSQCGKGFAFRSMLTTHIAFVHSLERPYSCTECNKTYKMKSQLRQHMMTHTMARTGTSPFMCGKCGRPMASKTRLHAHTARCKGNNAYKQLQVLWRTGVGPSGTDNRLQSVDLLSGQAVNLQAPLVDLLPGQRINIVHHGFGKNATITLVPVQNDSADQGQDHTMLLSDSQDPASLTTPTPALVVKQEGPDKDGLNQPGGPDSAANCREADASDATDNNSQESILVQSSFSQTEATLGHLPNMTEASETSTPISVSSSFDSNNHQTLLVQNGNTVHLLTSDMQDNPGQLQTQNTDSAEEAGKPLATSTTSTGQSESDGLSSQQIMALSSDQQFHTTLQNVSSSHQLVLSDGLGQMQTILLPPDFVKQEVVVVDGVEGRSHQNVINLSNFQIVADQMDVQFEEVSDAASNSRYCEDDKVSAAQPGSSDVMPQLVQSNTGEASEALDRSQSVGEVEFGEIYMCSMCSQQFESMDLAEQHVLLHHSQHDIDGSQA